MEGFLPALLTCMKHDVLRRKPTLASLIWWCKAWHALLLHLLAVKGAVLSWQHALNHTSCVVDCNGRCRSFMHLGVRMPTGAQGFSSCSRRLLH